MVKKINRKDFFKTGATSAASLGITTALAGDTKAAKASETRQKKNGTYTVRIAGRPYCWQVKIDKNCLAELTPVKNTFTDLWLTRGLVDIQVNGYQGVEITDPNLTVDNLAKCEQALLEQGTTLWCPTVTSQTSELISHVLAKISDAVKKGILKNVKCIHLEAVYLSPEDGYRGAHLAKYLHDPDISEFEKWQKAAGGLIGYVSVAPELKGGLEFIRYLASKGILVALAHHNAPYETVAAAADAGARLSTHLFNGCAASMHRHHNVVLSQLSEDRLWASFIPDGHHIPYHVLEVGLRAKGIQRSVFTSDLVSLGGTPDGEYLIDGQTAVIRDGGAFLKGTPYLYGAWANLAQGIERATAAGAVTADEAIRLASTNPARLLGVKNNYELMAGSSGPFVLFREKDGALRLEDVI